eukprot:scaffold92123_cov16-Prasinocladus_malaysianus.AAC.3
MAPAGACDWLEVGTLGNAPTYIQTSYLYGGATTGKDQSTVSNEIARLLVRTQAYVVCSWTTSAMAET